MQLSAMPAPAKFFGAIPSQPTTSAAVSQRTFHPNSVATKYGLTHGMQIARTLHVPTRHSPAQARSLSTAKFPRQTSVSIGTATCLMNFLTENTIPVQASHTPSSRNAVKTSTEQRQAGYSPATQTQAPPTEPKPLPIFRPTFSATGARKSFSTIRKPNPICSFFQPPSRPTTGSTL